MCAAFALMSNSRGRFSGVLSSVGVCNHAWSIEKPISRESDKAATTPSLLPSLSNMRKCNLSTFLTVFGLFS